MKNFLIFSLKAFLLIGSIILLITVYVFGFGWIFSSCNYTEKSLKIPDDLNNKQVLLESDVYSVVGKSRQCTQILGGINNELISNTSLKDSYTFGEYYTKQGRVVNPFAKGQIFKIRGIVSTTNFGPITFEGITTLYYLLLEDQTGGIFLVNSSDLGRKNVFMTYDYNGRKRYLGSLYLNYLYDENQKAIGQYYKFDDYYIE